MKESAPINSSINELIKSITGKNSNVSTYDIKSLELENDYTEGTKRKRLSSYYERNPKLREQAIRIHGSKCMVKSYSFNIENFYGYQGKGFIEVQHIVPISTFEKEKNVNPEKELIVACSNCHRMLHRKKDNPLSIE